MNRQLNLSEKLQELYASQQIDWPQFKDAVQSLTSVKTRTLIVEGSEITLQNNPARIRSTGAAIDKKSLEQRACFLCEQNRPSEQRGVDVLGGKYVALVNPFPILPMHFTVVSKDHVAQDLKSSLKDFLELASFLDENSVLIFNGAKAGASAPDHCHFQIIPKSGLSLCRQIQNEAEFKEQGSIVFSFASAALVIYSSSSIIWLEKYLSQGLEKLKHGEDKHLELINLMAWKSGKVILVTLVPRTAHRPSCYFKEDPEKILISPAAIELSGVLVLPRYEDFEKISEANIARIFQEVCYNAEQCSCLLK